jgi:fused signal recognition particle receptor
MAFFGLFGKQNKDDLDRGLAATREGFLGRIARAVAGKSKVDDEVLDQVEEALLSSDVGVPATLRIIERLQQRVARDKYVGTSELNRMLREEIVAMLDEGADHDAETRADARPFVILVVGVNGTGKTTTIGKLAWRHAREGRKVLLGAADTFRAAAVGQLKTWGERAGVPVVSQGMGADPASVAFDAARAGQAQGCDLVIIDTAGRLHNKTNLMNELAKIRRVIGKAIPGAPHEVLLVLDASTGQNALEQARQFTAATEVNALALTKLDGTARGGVVIGVSGEFRIPVRYVGVGEKPDDLQPFDARTFVESLFAESGKSMTNS